jgi:hypothetical protein
MRNNSLKSSSPIQFNESDDKKMSVEECVKRIRRAIEQKKESEILTLSGKLAVMMQPFFPTLVRKIAAKKSGGSALSKL